MSCRSYGPYRGYTIEVQVSPVKSLTFHVIAPRYGVSWIISSHDPLNPLLASFPERVEFLSEAEAFRYGEKRAHTFIDSIVCAKRERVESTYDVDHI